MSYGSENEAQRIDQVVLTAKIWPPTIMRSLTPAEKKKKKKKGEKNQFHISKGQLIVYGLSRRYQCSHTTEDVFHRVWRYQDSFELTMVCFS